MKIFASIFFIVFLFLQTNIAKSQTQFSLQKEVLAHGCAIMSNDSYIMNGTLSQMSIGTSSNSGFQSYIGFWYGINLELPLDVPIEESISIDDADLIIVRPNPTSGETYIDFKLHESTYVSIKLYSMTGHLIQTISEAEMASGLHTINFDGSRLANGVYNLQMIVDGKSVSRLLV